VRILWDNSEKRFQAELTQGDSWRDDMEYVKGAGFRTTGPPHWIWYTGKIEVLNKLRKHRPKSGLMITEQALEQFNLLKKKFDEKAELKKTFSKATKAAKKASKDPEISGMVELCIPDKGYLDASDFPVLLSTRAYIPPPGPKETCLICEDPLYQYERHLICLFCEKELDK
jgi:hypothetical protein